MTCLADERALYRIRIQGRLGRDRSGWLTGMTMVVRDDRNLGAITDLTAPIADQAALMGFLQELYGLGATLLSIERLEDAAELEDRGQ